MCYSTAAIVRFSSTSSYAVPHTLVQDTKATTALLVAGKLCGDRVFARADRPSSAHDPYTRTLTPDRAHLNDTEHSLRRRTYPASGLDTYTHCFRLYQYLYICCIVDAFPTGTLTVPPAPGYDMHNYIPFVAAKPQEQSTASHFLKR